MPQPDRKLRGSLGRSLEKANLRSSPCTIILNEFSTIVERRRGTYHHESALLLNSFFPQLPCARFLYSVKGEGSEDKVCRRKRGKYMCTPTSALVSANPQSTERSARITGTQRMASASCSDIWWLVSFTCVVNRLVHSVFWPLHHILTGGGSSRASHQTSDTVVRKYCNISTCNWKDKYSTLFV